MQIAHSNDLCRLAPATQAPMAGQALYMAGRKREDNVPGPPRDFRIAKPEIDRRAAGDAGLIYGGNGRPAGGCGA